MKKIIITLCFIVTCNTVFSSEVKTGYYLKLEKVQEKDVAVSSCTYQNEVERCESIRLLRDFNPNYYPSLTSLLTPVVAVADVVTLFTVTTLGWVATPLLAIAGFGGTVFTLANFKYANPYYYYKKSSLTASLNDLNLKKVGDVKLFLYRDQYNLDMSVDLMINL